MSQQIPIGLLFSVSGTDKSIGIEALDGAMMAIDEINKSPEFDFLFTPIVRDPGNSLSLFRRHAEELSQDHGCNQIIGTVTSSARKEVIPVVEKHDALLWYCCPYEGFESSENVIYISATPSLHIAPLFQYMIPRYGSNAYAVGSNYIWGWETARVARELLTACNGQMLSDRYVPLGSEDIDHVILDIEQKQPNFVLNNLIGSSSYAFFKAYKALGERNSDFKADNCPIVSCNIAECEIDSIGMENLKGHYTAAVYFENQQNSENQQMLDLVKERFNHDRRCSNYLTANYTAVKMLAAAIKDCGSDRMEAVRSNLHARHFQTALGPLKIDPMTNHAALRPGIGKFIGQEGFEIVSSSESLMEADPYFVNFDPTNFAQSVEDSRSKSNAFLRVVN